jgi:anaphase-promoting complex subunit 6
VHFATGNYTRAQSLLSKSDLIARNASCRYLAAHCLIKQSRFDEALSILGERNPTHLIPTAANKRKAQASGRGGQAGKGGSKTVSELSNGDAEAEDEEASNRRYEAGMCYLRGICYAKQNAFDRAKECYKDAVRIDVQCFEAFQQLTKNSLMSPDEEWEFLESLNFASIAIDGASPDVALEAADFTRALYSTRLSKYRDPDAFTAAAESLATHYNLGANADLLLARADLLFTQSRYKDAYEITSAILEDDKYNFAVYPTHLACLYELRMKNHLFLVAHDLADNHPDEPCTWLAVGIYYFAIDKIPEARRYFSKASMMDAHFGAAWMGFAHTFAAEGEYDQAISAYSTAARLFTGTHLPQVFLGMQNHAMNNMTVAQEFLETAYELCSEDPLLLNELGIVHYHQGKLERAEARFRAALDVARGIDADPGAWLSARTNLAHALRRQGRFDEALAEFDEVLRAGGRDAAVFAAKGLIFLEMGRSDDAAAVLHDALALSPQDPTATELLNKALEETAGRGADLRGDDDGDEMGEEEEEVGRGVGWGVGGGGGGGGGGGRGGGDRGGDECL